MSNEREESASNRPALSRRSVLRAGGALALGLPLAQFGLMACSSSTSAPKTGGSASGSGGSKASTKKSVNLATSFDLDPIFTPDGYAIELMKQDHGISVNQKTLTGATTVFQALIAGQIDIVAGTPTAGIAAVAKSQNVTAVFPGDVVSGHAIIVDSGIKGWSDVEGKTFGITSKTDSSYWELALLFAQHDVDINKVKFETVKGTSARAAALAAGKIDGGSVELGAAAQLLDKSGGKLARLSLVGQELPKIFYIAYFVRSSFLESNADVVQAYATSIMKATRAMANEATYLQKAAQLSGPKYSQDVLKGVWDLGKQIDLWDPNQAQWTAANGDYTASEMARLQVIPEDVPFSKWGTTQFVEAARSSLGPVK